MVYPLIFFLRTSTAYTYGTSGNEKGRLIKMQTGNNYVSFTYNKYGQPATEQRNVDGSVQLDFMYQYNSKSQLQTTTYPGNVQVSNEYNAYGNLVKVNAGAQTVWELTGNTGTVATTQLGGSSGMTAKRTHNAQGLLTNLNTVKGATTIRNMDYVFNASTGNLTSRTGMIGPKETFYYDNLDRLTTVNHGTPEVLNMAVNYAANGNIQNKTDLGTYAYGENGAGPHALTGVDNTGGLINTRKQTIDYNAFNKATVKERLFDDEPAKKQKKISNIISKLAYIDKKIKNTSQSVKYPVWELLNSDVVSSNKREK